MKEKNTTKLWAIHYVDDKAKDKAKKLAKANKQNIGEWLNDLILNERNINVSSQESFPFKILSQSLDNINMKLDELSEEVLKIQTDKTIPNKSTILNKLFG